MHSAIRSNCCTLNHFLWFALLLLITGLTRLPNLSGDEATRKVQDQAAIQGAAIKSGLIKGRLTDVAKQPVVAAMVTLYRWHSPSQRWGRWKVEGRPVPTDKDGHYQFRGLADGYYMISVESAGMARTFGDSLIEEQRPQQVNLVLQPPASPILQFENQAGQPVRGVRVREYRQRGVNGDGRYPQLSLETLGIEIPESDEHGDLRLPPLPKSDVLNVFVEHSQFAPAQIEALKVTTDGKTRVTLHPGVAVNLHVPVEQASGGISGAIVDFRFEPFIHPSSYIQYEAKFDSLGTAQLSVARGDFGWLLLQHEDYFITPVFSANYRKKQFLKIEPGRNQDLHFKLHRKVKVSGRILNVDTGQPLSEASVMGELPNDAPKGWDDLPPDRWAFAEWGDSDQEGRYSLNLAAGRARLSFHGSGYIPEQEYYEIDVAADGSTVLPEIRVRSLKKVTGLVQNADGSPAVRAVVRLRGRSMVVVQPVLTDESGRFEIQPNSVPVDDETNRRVFQQSVVAFDPYRPLAARADVRLDQPHDVVLKLEPHEPDWPLKLVPEEMGEWASGIISPEQASRYAAISLRDRPAPELDALDWINTNGKAQRLGDLRGKYVLLDFWFTGCGPCHGDFPSVKLVHELYRNQGVVVIGVHNNSNTPEEVKAHVAKIGLPFPIAVDFPDGRTVARYEPHGIPGGYPNYVLISPEGKVLLDDRTIPHPSLRSYKLEIIRKYLLEKSSVNGNP